MSPKTARIAPSPVSRWEVWKVSRLGLTHTGQFAWVGGFSSAVQKLDYSKALASLDPKAADLRLLWIACEPKTV